MLTPTESLSPIPTPRAPLKGLQIAIPGEDPSEIDRMGNALIAELKPRGELSHILLEQIAPMTVRTRRCARFERATSDRSVREASHRAEVERLSSLDDLVSMIASDPSAVVGKLMESREGVDRLVVEWSNLLADLDGLETRRWMGNHLQRAENLAGRSPEDFPTSRIKALSNCCWGDDTDLQPGEVDGLDAKQKHLWSRAQIRAYLVAEIERLKAFRVTLDPLTPATPPVNQAEIADLAAFDPSPDAILARKYLVQCNRMLHKAIETYKFAQSLTHDTAEVVATPEPVVASNELGSFFQETCTPPALDRQPVSLTASPTPQAPSNRPIEARKAPESPADRST